MPTAQGCPHGCLPQSRFPQVPWRYRLSRRSSDRCLLYTGALLRKALDEWRLDDDALRHSYNPANELPCCSLDWGRRVFYVISGQPPAAVALMAHLSRSFDRWLLSHWRFFAALSAGSSAGGASRTSAPLLALSTGPMIFPVLWQVPRGSHLLQVTPKFRLTSRGFCSGGAVLTLVHGSLHTSAILSALGRWCLQQ